MIVPGYGLAVAQAGAIVAEIALHLRKQVGVLRMFIILMYFVVFFGQSQYLIPHRRTTI